MQAILRLPRSGWLCSGISIAGVVIFGLAVGVVMAPHAPVVGDRRSELICLQLAFSPERATEIVMSFDLAMQNAIAAMLVPGDLLLAWGYGLTLAGLVGLMARRFDGAWRRAGAIAMWFPIAAALLDCIEDAFLYSIVTQLSADPNSTVNAAMPLFASIAATLKYIFLCVLTPAFAVAGTVHGLRVDRSAAALVVYAILLLLCAMFVQMPAQQMPACFV